MYKLEQAIIFQSPGHYNMSGLPETWDGEDDTEIRRAINENCGWGEVELFRGARQGVPGFAKPGITFVSYGVSVVYVEEKGV